MDFTSVLPCPACVKHAEPLTSRQGLIRWHLLTSRCIMQLPTRSPCKLKGRVFPLGLPSKEHQFLPSTEKASKKGTWRAGAKSRCLTCHYGDGINQTSFGTCWSWRQTCVKPSKQDLVAIPVGHRIPHPICCTASWENNFSSLPPDFSRFTLPPAHIFIANPFENFISTSSFHLWCGIIPSPTAGIQMKCFSSDPA